MQSVGARNALFTQYAESCIRVKARQLSRRSEFRVSDEDDLRQDLWLSLLAKAECFDSERAASTTFISHVVNSTAGMILRRPYRQKRAAGRHAISLDTIEVTHDGEGKKPLAHCVSERDLSRRTGAKTHDHEQHRDDAAAVEHALGMMPSAMRDVCRLVMGGSIASAARDLGTSRHRIREMLLAARPYLEQAGFGGN